MRGKNYAISDLHGMYDLYETAVESLTPRDRLFIIGDVIDRSDGGIKILQDIIKRDNEYKESQKGILNKLKGPIAPKIEFLLGNHELAFLEIMGVARSMREPVEDFLEFCVGASIHYRKNIDFFASEKDMARDFQLSEYRIKEIQDSYNEKDYDLTEYEEGFINNWITRNGGLDTIKNFNALTKKDQNEMLKFLNNSAVAIAQTIKKERFVFVHARPINSKVFVEKFKDMDGKFIYSKCRNHEKMVSYILEDRDDSVYEDFYNKYNLITICGHTADTDVINQREKGWVRIDTGCSSSHKGAKLSMYCIDDNVVEYFYPQPKVKNEEEEKRKSLESLRAELKAKTMAEEEAMLNGMK